MWKGRVKGEEPVFTFSRHSINLTYGDPAMGEQSNPRYVSLLQSGSRTCSVIAFGVGALALLGWILDIPILKSFHPGLVAMKANTATAFMLSGVSLLLLQPGKTFGRRVRFARFCAGGVTLLGLITLGEYFSGLDFGIDQLLFTEPAGAVGTAIPGRMAPNTAFNFVLLGLALMFPESESSKRYRPSQFLAMGALAVAFLALIGYAFDVKALRGISSYTSMALNTMLAFLALSLGVLWARPDKGLMALLTGNGAGAKSARRLLPAVTLIPVALGFLLMEGERSGLVGADFGLSLMVLLIVLPLVSLVWWDCHFLERMDAERRQSEEALKESERNASALINAADESIWLFGLNKQVLDANVTAVGRVGMNVDEVAGKTLTDLFPQHLAESRKKRMDEVIITGKPVRFEDERAGIIFDQTFYPVRNKAGSITAIATFSRDITDRKRAEEDISRRNALLSGINCIFKEALTCETEEELAMACMKVVEGITGSRFGFIGEIGADGLFHDIAISETGWDVCTLYDRFGERRPPASLHIHGIYGRVLLDGRSFFTNDPASHPDSIGLPDGHPAIAAFLGVPLMSDGKTIGMIAVGNRDGGYREEELESLEAMAPAIVEAFQRKRAEEAILGLNATLKLGNAQLEAANRELKAFNYSLSHDLRSPLRGIDGFSLALLQDYADKLDSEGREHLQRIRAASQRMGQLIDDLQELSRVTRRKMTLEKVDLGAMASRIADELRSTAPQRQADFVIAEGLVADADPRLLAIVLHNLLGNAWKFTGKQPDARIEFGCGEEDGCKSYFVRDNGVGFDMAYAGKLFGAFQRLHAMDEFPGTGIGLATVQRIVQRHGGRIWAESAVNKGATFHFTL